MNYTREQKRAIETIGQNLQIIACAGSGKTQVISQRVVNIIQSGIIPSNITAFTYTDKAAAELKTRILKLCREQLGEINGISEMYIGTIHGWCLRILQDLIYEYQKFSILDEIKLKLFVDRYYNSIGMKDMSMDRFKDTGLFIELMTVVRESDISPGREIPAEVKAALTNFEATLEKHAYFDFTAIMTKALHHLKNDFTFKEKLKDSVKYLIVDEYQDVNPIQEKLIEELAKLGGNVCVVGDDDQTLYQWRGSDVGLIQKFRDRYYNVEYIPLEDNFRSTTGIVDVAQKVVANNNVRLGKGMIAKGHQNYEKGDILYNQFENTDDEYDFIANSIHNLRGVEFMDKPDSQPRGLDYSDFTILLRTWKKAEGIISKLEEHGIPYIVAGVNNLFQTPEVKAAKAIYDFLAHEIDEQYLENSWLHVSDKIDKVSLRAAIKGLEKRYPELNTYYERFNIQEIYWSFLDKAGIREGLFTESGDGRNSSGYRNEEVVFYNLGMFSQMINDFETIYFTYSADRKLSTFLNFIRYAADGYYPEGWMNNTYKIPNAVQIMTIYQSKGLEYPVVFIPGLNRNYLPIKGRGGKSVWHFLNKEIIEDHQRYMGGIEDERRLMYVGITRSKKFLIITRAPEGNNRLYQRESSFGAEIRQSDYLFSSKDRDYSERKRIATKSSSELSTISLNFSLLKSYFDCPYSFKFFSFYGFQQPLGARIGYGKSMHNALMEIHRNFLDGLTTSYDDIPGILEKHIHFPYATTTIVNDMTQKAQQSLTIYLDKNQKEFNNIEFAEKEIQIDLGEGIMVSGRMDLIKKKNLDGTYQSTIIDFKSSENVQDYNASHQQLSLYALGYRELTGEKADFLEIYNLDDNVPYREELTVDNLFSIKKEIIEAANNIRSNNVDHCCNGPQCVCKFKN